MSRTIEAIQRHMTPPSKREAVELSRSETRRENGNSADRKHSLGYALRKLRLAFAPRHQPSSQQLLGKQL